MAQLEGKRRRRIPWLYVNVAVCAMWLAVPGIRRSMRSETCNDNLMKVSVATLLYSWDSDGRMPSAATWAGQIQRYTDGQKQYACPDLEDRKPDQFGHAYADALSAKVEPKIANESAIPMLFDSSDLRWNAHGGLEILAKGGRQNAAFLDGSVRPVAPSDFRR